MAHNQQMARALYEIMGDFLNKNQLDKAMVLRSAADYFSGKTDNGKLSSPDQLRQRADNLYARLYAARRKAGMGQVEAVLSIEADATTTPSKRLMAEIKQAKHKAHISEGW